MRGFVHSVESMSSVDGPGVRSVVFMQGCRLRCKYCHNPDTWEITDKSTVFEPEELAKRLLRFREYYGETGGVTFSGGEPLLQAEFVTEVFSRLKDRGIHTCLDTAGVGCTHEESYSEKITELLSYTDLVLLDVKHHDPEKYRSLTGRSMDDFNLFLELVQKSRKRLWLRHVVVPGLTDGSEHIRGLREYISTIENVEKAELLPYHTMGVHKYEERGIPYPLADTEPLSTEELLRLSSSGQ